MNATQPAKMPRPGMLRHACSALLLPWASRKIDVVSLGYPKTGNTWFSMLCRKLIVEHYGFAGERIGDILPDSVRSLLRYRKQASPIVYITHHMPWYTDTRAADLRLSLRAFKGKKAIFLARDPKDTLVSLYMHARYREGWYLEDLESFVFNDYFGIAKYIAYYNQLHAARDNFEQTYLVRYEDLSRDASVVMREVAAFIGIPDVGENTLESVIRFCGIENMRKMEREGTARWWAMKPPLDTQDPNAFKARQGRVGGFAEHLPSSTVKQIDLLVRTEMPEVFGYGTE